jgi:hypothetical protein
VLIFIFVLPGKCIEFDDDNPNVRKEDYILKLSGGGEHHLAHNEIYFESFGLTVAYLNR